MIGKVRVCNLDLSKLMIGTAQFGLNYGIANKTGQVKYEVARDIMACAYDGGVNCIDTAALYGTSEEVIGKALDELGLTDKFVIVTKLPSMDNKYNVGKDADEFVEESVKRSMEHLRVEKLDFCFFHRDTDSKYFNSLQRVKDLGLVKNIGFSVVFTQDAPGLFNIVPDAMQIPFNIIDKRPFEISLFDRVIKDDIALFIRSVYLQGLLLMPDDMVMNSLKDIIPIRNKLRKIADRLHISFAELCMNYVTSTKGVTSTIVGVETVEQMLQNIELFKNEPLDDETINEVKTLVPLFHNDHLAPHLWIK